MLKEGTENAFNGKQKDSVREETSVVSGTMKISVQNRHQKPLHFLKLQHKEAEARREKKNVFGRSPSGKFDRQPCTDYLKGTCTKSLCDYWHLPECQLQKSESGCKFGDKCSFAYRQLDGQRSKKPKKDGDKSAVAMLKDARQLVCLFQDTELPESCPISRKNPKVLGSIRQVRFTKATQRHANIRENRGPSLRTIQVKVPHQSSPYALKFEDWSQEETERHQRCARGDAWRLGQEYFEAQRKGQSYFFSHYQRTVSLSFRNETGEKRVRCRFRSIGANFEQERRELRRMGNRSRVS